MGDDGKFKLPELITREHIVKTRNPNPDYLFDMPAVGLAEQRAERARSIAERCEMAAEIANNYEGSVVCWCHLNSEGDRLTKLIPDAIQVSGKDSDEQKEERFRAFESGEARVIVTKPTIAGFGLNWQHCNRQTFFPSHSFEQWYQAVRRSWRFGQEDDVIIDVIASEGEQRVLSNINRKAEAADEIFSELVSLMNEELKIEHEDNHTQPTKIPSWL